MNDENNLQLGGAPLTVKPETEKSTPVSPETGATDPNFSNRLPDDAEPSMEEMRDDDAPDLEGKVQTVQVADQTGNNDNRIVIPSPGINIGNSMAVAAPIIADKSLEEIAAENSAKVEVILKKENPLQSLPTMHPSDKPSEPTKAETSPQPQTEEDKLQEETMRREFAGLFGENNQLKRGTDDDDSPDLLFNAVVTGNQDDVNNFLSQYKTDKELQEAVNDETSFAAQLAEVGAHGWGASSYQSSERDILRSGDTYKKLVATPEMVRDFFTHGAKYNANTPANLTGRKARVAVMARMRGLQKVNLLNSGFYLILRAPQMAELQEFASSVQIDATEFGRQLGNHFGLCTDIFIKAKFMELLTEYDMIVDSNFVDIDKKGKLAANMSIFDYDVVMWAMVSLMYRKGLRTKIACSRCKTATTDNLVDVLSAKWLNNDLYTEEVINYWNAKTDEKGKPIMRTEADLKHYRDEILNQSSKVKQIHDEYRMALIIKDPMMERYLNVGEELMNNLNKTLHGPTRLREDQIKMKSIVHLFQMFAPWVSKLEFLDEDDNTTFTTTETSAIMDALDTSIQRQFDLVTDIGDFTAKSRFNHIGTFSIECPNCHAKPETNLDNFFPLDVETIFFALSCRP